MKTQETQLIIPSNIRERVNTTNSFTKEEYLVHREEISLARKEKKLAFQAMTSEQVTQIVAQYNLEGYKLSDKKHKALRTGEKITLEFTKPKIKKLSAVEEQLARALEIIKANGLSL
jgi:bifunctional DNA-binding transcriptional regulator/antitoxin component of YhaV-PrlF toxin-antitoxin module